MNTAECQSSSVLPRRRTAFTLIELLAVMAVMLVMLALLMPSLTGIKGAGDLTKAAYDISGTLEQARAYAMASNTFVFVGFEEVDSTQPDSAKPQKDAAGGVGGRVAVAVVASRDGIRGYGHPPYYSIVFWKRLRRSNKIDFGLPLNQFRTGSAQPDKQRFACGYDVLHFEFGRMQILHPL